MRSRGPGGVPPAPHTAGGELLRGTGSSSDRVSLCVIFYLGNASGEGSLLGDGGENHDKVLRARRSGEGEREQPDLPPPGTPAATAAASPRLSDGGGMAKIPEGGSGTRLTGADLDRSPNRLPSLAAPARPHTETLAAPAWRRRLPARCSRHHPHKLPPPVGSPSSARLSLIGYCCQGSHLSSAAHPGAGANPADAVQTPSVRAVRRSRDAKAAGEGALPQGGTGAGHCQSQKVAGGGGESENPAGGTLAGDSGARRGFGNRTCPPAGSARNPGGCLSCGGHHKRCHLLGRGLSSLPGQTPCPGQRLPQPGAH